MATTIGQMSRSDLQQLIERVVEEKLLCLLGDPDEDLLLKKGLRDRLVRQQKATARGDRGDSLQEVAIAQARRQVQEGRTIGHGELKRELGLD